MLEEEDSGLTKGSLRSSSLDVCLFSLLLNGRIQGLTFSAGFVLPLKLSGETKSSTRGMGYGPSFGKGDLAVQSITNGRDHDRRMQQHLKGFNVRLRDIYRLGTDPRLIPRVL